MIVAPSKRCKTCSKKFKKGEETASIRMDTLEGVHEIEICLECADFFDQSAEVLLKIKRKEPDESE